MLLIFPPLAKPSEPPAGIAKLKAALQANGIRCRAADMNREALEHVFRRPPPASTDTWTRRAVKNIADNIAALQKRETYDLSGRYSRAVNDVSRVLEAVGKQAGVIAGLADYRDANLSPVRSVDLIRASREYQGNLFYPYFEKRLPELMEKTFTGETPLNDRWIGFSLNYLSQALCTFSMIGFLKKEFPRCKIVLGGGLVTSWMKRPGWNNPFAGLVDHLVSGPGEEPLLALLQAEEKAGPCAPDYDDFTLREYLAPGFILPYSASSGCYWNKCSFCPERAEKNEYRMPGAGRAMAEVASLIEKKKPVLVHFLDNAMSPALMKLLAEEPPGVSWYGFARFGKELLDWEYCEALARSGCVMLKLGLESGDQQVLDGLNKGIDLEDASAILKNLRRAGIGAYVYLLFGTPEESPDQAKKTLDFVARHHEAITFLNLAIFNMPICGEEQGERDRPLFYEGDLSLYTDFRHPAGWGRIQVRRFLDEEFKRSRAVASILKNDPPFFTSNHAAFFVKAVMEGRR